MVVFGSIVVAPAVNNVYQVLIDDADGATGYRCYLLATNRIFHFVTGKKTPL